MHVWKSNTNINTKHKWGNEKAPMYVYTSFYAHIIFYKVELVYDSTEQMHCIFTHNCISLNFNSFAKLNDDNKLNEENENYEIISSNENLLILSTFANRMGDSEKNAITSEDKL